MSIDVAVLLLLALVAGVWLLERVIARTEFGLGLALVLVGADVLQVPVEIVVGSLRVTELDVGFGVLAVAAVARVIRSPALSPLQWLLLALLVLVGASTVNGVLEFGIGTAVNEARTHVRFIAAALYFSTVEGDGSRFDRLARAWFAVAGFLVVLTVVRWLGLVAGFTGAWWMGGADDLRVIDGFSTLVLVQVLLIIWGTKPPVPRWATVAGPVLLAAVVLLQHRTLWVALAVGALVWAVRDRRIATRVVPAFLLAILVGGVLVFTVFGDPASIRQDLEASATNADTFQWRAEGWYQLLFVRGPDEPVEVAFGLPFGSGYDRRIAGQTISVSPHNFFVEIYLRTGVLGVFVTTLLFAVTLHRLQRRAGWGRFLHADALLVILVTQLLFLQTSHPSAEQGIFMGLALATAAGGRRAAAPRPTDDVRLPRPAPRRVAVGTGPAGPPRTEGRGPW